MNHGDTPADPGTATDTGCPQVPGHISQCISWKNDWRFCGCSKSHVCGSGVFCFRFTVGLGKESMERPPLKSVGPLSSFVNVSLPFVCQVLFLPVHLLPRNSLVPDPGAQEGVSLPCHTVYHLSLSVVELLRQHCHTLFFQKAFFPGRCQRAFFVSVSRAGTCSPPQESAQPRHTLCPKPAQALRASVADARGLGGPAHPANSTASWPRWPASVTGAEPLLLPELGGKKEEVRMRFELQPNVGVTLVSGVKI